MVTVKPRGKKWQCNIQFRWPDGTPFRERITAPVASKSGAQRWATTREGVLLAAGRDAYQAPRPGAPPPAPAVDAVPTLAEFWPRVVLDWYRAQRKKASTTAAAETIAKVHLLPAFGARPLDKITTADVAALKGALSEASPSTVNNVVSVLSRSLRCAVDWGVIPALPCKFGMLKKADAERDFYEVDEYRRLVGAAAGSRRVLVLLAGSAGLRRGELIALKWTDLDMVRRVITVRTSTWQTIEGTPKSGHARPVPMTDELHAALTEHLAQATGPHVLYADAFTSARARGVPCVLTNRIIRNWLSAAQAAAGLPATGAIHKLRHTFCSHLAAAGVPARAIQGLAGHSDLKTTQRYMHLSSSNRDEAMVRLQGFYAGRQPTCARIERSRT